MNQEQISQVKHLAKSCNDALEKLAWKWEPKVGEWFVDMPSNEIFLIDYDTFQENKDDFDHFRSYAIPILHWEEIEWVLEGVGYRFSVRRNVNPDSNGICLCDCIISDSNGHRVQVISKSRQEAVMKAVIELGEEPTCHEK